MRAGAGFIERQRVPVDWDLGVAMARNRSAMFCLRVDVSLRIIASDFRSEDEEQSGLQGGKFVSRGDDDIVSPPFLEQFPRRLEQLKELLDDGCFALSGNDSNHGG